MNYVERSIRNIKKLPLVERNQLERKTLQTLLNSEKKLGDLAEEQMIVEANWVDKYKEYIQKRSIDLTKADLLPPFSNNIVIDKAQVGTLKESDYYKLSESVFRLIDGVYSGGPEISESKLNEILHECNIRDDTKEDTHIQLTSITKFTVKTKKSVNSRFLASPKPSWKPADKVIFSPESTQHYRHMGDKAVSSMSSLEDFDNEDEEFQTPAKKKKLQLINFDDEGTLSSILRSMKQISAKKKQKISNKKITFEEDIKEKLLKYSKEYYSDIKIPKEEFHNREFDTLKKASSDPNKEINKNGFINTQVYCYLNAVIQFLLSAEEFINLIMEGQYTKKITKKTRFSYELKEGLKRNREVDLAEIEVTDMLFLFKKHIDLDLQQDAHEFMRLLLDKVHLELKPKPKKKNQKHYKYSWDNFKVYDISPVTCCFAGELTRKTQCFNCMKLNEKKESFLELSLNVETDFDSIEDSLVSFFDSELIEDDYACDKCNKRAPASSKIFLSQFPRYLTIHLKQFSYFPQHKKVEHYLIHEHQDMLDLSPFTGGLSKPKYRLISTVVHNGNIQNGHYTACSKRNGKWYSFDDEDVYRSNLKKVLQKQSYLFLYELVSNDQ